VQAQDCSNGRYGQEIFTDFDLTADIVYGNNVTWNNSGSIDVELDVYQPTGDTETARPLLIFIHGGTFIGGGKQFSDVKPLAEMFARKGYVTSSMNYRLGMNNLLAPGGPDESDASEAVMRGTQDARAAVRFFKKSVKDNGNPYGIDTTNIFLVGSSAGGFVALHLAYLDQVSEIPAAIDMSDASLAGGLEGNSGSPQNTSDVRAIVSISGAIGDTTWMENNSTPVLSLHGDADGTVPFGTGIAVSIMEVDGSESVHIKAENEGIKNCFKAEYGAGHVPHTDTPEYLDTAELYITQFLLSEVCGAAEYCVCNTPADPVACHPLNGTTGIQIEEMDALLKMYPNPAQNEVAISLEGLPIEKVVFADVNGRIVQQVNPMESYMNIDISKMTQGVYFVKVITANGILTRKLIIE
jgi:poly(3-hydroxybutyrate) depolymerase